jgi:hypothetical protein
MGNNEWRTSPCTGLVLPDQSCAEETFDGDFTLTSVGLGLLMTQPLSNDSEFFASAEYSRFWVGGEWKGRDTGARIGQVPDEGVSGWGWQVGIFRQFWNDGGLRISVRQDLPNFSTCGEDAYFPFCGSKAITSILVGYQRGTSIER